MVTSDAFALVAKLVVTSAAFALVARLVVTSAAFGGFADSFYWSSSEDDDDEAWAQNLNFGAPIRGGKVATSYVRAIRAF